MTYTRRPDGITVKPSEPQIVYCDECEKQREQYLESWKIKQLESVIRGLQEMTAWDDDDSPSDEIIGYECVVCQNVQDAGDSCDTCGCFDMMPVYF